MAGPAFYGLIRPDLIQCSELGHAPEQTMDGQQTNVTGLTEHGKRL